MRNKKTFSFDEEGDALNILAKGFPNGIDYSQMYLLAKYFRHTYGYGAVRLEKELVTFCKTQDENFNPITEADSIKKWVRSAMKYEMRKIDSVCISQKEIDFLKTVEIPKERKLLYTALVLSKALKKRHASQQPEQLQISEHHYIHYGNFQDIIRLAGLKNISEIDLAGILHKHMTHLTFYKAEKELIRLDYAEAHGEGGIAIDDMTKIMDYYSMLFEKSKFKPSYCSNCGRGIIKNTNHKIYCNECAKIVKTEKTRLRVARLRQNKPM
jgi:hypothetical protein